jgi:hypothetical protein
MAGNGILDYQGMNQAIYRGATSNIIVDTQSMSIEIGAGNSSHTSNLHIECDHAANVASIQLNSNVVTEFSRSKKLIKYPRVAMSQNDESSTSGYVVSASSNNGGLDPGYKLFNNNTGDYWHTDYPLYSSTPPYIYTGGEAISTYEGEWVTIDLNENIKLDNVSLYNRNGYTNQATSQFVILGGSDNLNWNLLSNVTSTSWISLLPNNIIVNSEQYYRYYAFVFTHANSSINISLGQIELFGTPEYDPEAHGTDVTVKSVPNVPNTDWLEVYYDAKNYTSGVVQDLSTNSFNGTLTNGASFNNSDGISKFAFDAGTNQYMTTTTDISGVDFTHTTSMWVKFVEVSTDSNDQHYLFMLGAFGSNSIGMYYSANQGIRVAPTGFDYRSQYHPVAGNWFHVSYTYAGGAHGTAAMNTTVKFYINGQQWGIPAYYGSTSTVTLPSSSVLQINGSAGNNNTLMDMEVANFRLFNRALTSDEIYQLYAYQKEYFGHGDLSMTLKAGRLGIGTSEPRGALDVRGDAYYGCPVFFTAYYGNSGSNNNIAAGSSPNYTTLVFNHTMVNKGGAYNLSTGRCTFPISGYYEVLFRGGSASTDGCQTWIFRNGVAPTTWTASGLKSVGAAWDSSSGTFRNLGIIHFFDYFEAGEYLDVRIVNGSFNASNYNSFSVKYLSN